MKFSSFLLSVLVIGHLIILAGTAGYFVGYEHGFTDGYTNVIESIKTIVSQPEPEVTQETNPEIP